MKENLVISVINMFDTSVTIKKGERIATAISCDDKTQTHLDNALYDRLKSVDEQKVDQIVGSIGQQGNHQNWSTADRTHFQTTINEKKEYLTKNLKLKQNKNIDTAEKLNRVLDVLIKNWEIFDITENRLAKCNTSVEHAIITTGKPIRGKTRPLNPVLGKQVRQQLLTWEKKNIIKKSRSPWSSPIVVVPKKNGKIRVCADYRELNKVTIKDSWPLPNIEASLASLAKQTLFSVIDCKEAYFTIPLDKDSIPKTPICTQFGLYEFLRMPYGISNAASCFARAIHEALNHLGPEVCLPYMDCLLYTSDAADE